MCFSDIMVAQAKSRHSRSKGEIGKNKRVTSHMSSCSNNIQPEGWGVILFDLMLYLPGLAWQRLSVGAPLLWDSLPPRWLSAGDLRLSCAGDSCPQLSWAEIAAPWLQSALSLDI